MPRARRVLRDGGLYHIVQRGHNKARLFEDAKDYRVFKKKIRKCKEKYPLEIYHYCLMPNHFHFLLRIASSNLLPKIIHNISQCYACHYKKRYDHVGYLYQNRYQSYIIENDSYLLTCGRYIERNPVRAGMVVDPSEYPWSSCSYYTKGRADDIICTDPLYFSMSKTDRGRKAAYARYITEPTPYDKLLDRAILR